MQERVEKNPASGHTGSIHLWGFEKKPWVFVQVNPTVFFQLTRQISIKHDDI